MLVGAGIYVGPKLVNVMQLAKDAKSMADESTVDTFKDGKQQLSMIRTVTSSVR